MSKRITIVFFLFAAFFLLVVARLFFWQVYASDQLQGLAERQTHSAVTLSAARGKILSSDSSPLVLNQIAYTVFAEPNKVKDQLRTASSLAKLLELPEASISARLQDHALQWISLAEKVQEEKVSAIKELNLAGIGFLEGSKRFYPEASMAAHVLGFVGKNAKGEDQGYFGIEGYYNEQLRGRDGILRREKDARGNPIIVGQLDEIPATHGWDITLTLDKTVQFIAEQKLKEGIEQYGAKGGTVTILDPQTGAILALSAFPSFHPGDFASVPATYYLNPVVSLSFEPGSTFKVLVVASALHEQKIKPDTIYDEDGPLEVSGYSVRTWNQKYHGRISIPQILEYSSNVGMVFIQRDMGRDLFFRYLTRLGVGELTDIDVQGELAPALRASKEWYDIDYATASFGQGIAVTPLQMVRAVASIANGGKLLRPHLVKSLRDENGKIILTEPKVEREIFGRKATSLVTEMMVQAVERGETRFIKNQGYNVAGKTGTAQIPIQGHYDTEKTIASFVGFAPAEAPRFVMLVTIQEPSTSPWGSETAAPVFFAIAKELFSYFGISPSP